MTLDFFVDWPHFYSFFFTSILIFLVYKNRVINKVLCRPFIYIVLVASVLISTLVSKFIFFEHIETLVWMLMPFVGLSAGLLLRHIPQIRIPYVVWSYVFNLFVYQIQNIISNKFVLLDISISPILRFVFLFIFSFAIFTDLYEKAIYTLPSILLLIAGITGSFFGYINHISFYESILCTVSTATVFTLISLISERILGRIGFGLGDVIFLVAISPFLGFLHLWMGVAIASCAGVIYLIAKRILDSQKDCSIPFVPFLWIGICFGAFLFNYNYIY